MDIERQKRFLMMGIEAGQKTGAVRSAINQSAL